MAERASVVGLATKGLYAYKSGKYSGIAYFGRGGSERDRLAIPHESDKYRPWNRYDPDIPAHIRDKLVELEDDDSTSIGQPPQPARTQPSTTPLSRDMPRGENILVSEHSLPNITEFIQFKIRKLMGNHGSKITLGVFCISIMRIRGRPLMEFR